MKTIFVVFTMLVCSSVLIAQDIAFTSSARQQASPVFMKSTRFQSAIIVPRLPGERMRNAGRTLTICGGAMAIGGIVLMNNADELYYTSTYTQNGTVTDGDPKGALGVLMTIGGVGMIVPGVILWSKGHKKYNRFLERQSVSMHASRGIAIRYSF
jgi:hypothetical protein